MNNSQLKLIKKIFKKNDEKFFIKEYNSGAYSNLTFTINKLNNFENNTLIFILKKWLREFINEMYKIQQILKYKPNNKKIEIFNEITDLSALYYCYNDKINTKIICLMIYYFQLNIDDILSLTIGNLIELLCEKKFINIRKYEYQPNYFKKQKLFYKLLSIFFSYNILIFYMYNQFYRFLFEKRNINYYYKIFKNLIMEEGFIFSNNISFPTIKYYSFNEFKIYKLPKGINNFNLNVFIKMIIDLNFEEIIKILLDE